MSETIRQHRSNQLSDIYAQLKKQDVEQFYADYQCWNLQRQAAALQEQIESLHRQITANTELLQLLHPPAIALAAMARLQASGVNDISLLDRMLERGEDWLDRTMQRLDYFEQLDFILDDYTQWCQNALEGAYDWIDSMREGNLSSPQVPVDDTSIETTEELFLQKLTSEDDEQLSQVSQVSQTVEISPALATPATPVEATPASDSSVEQSDQQDAPSTPTMEAPTPHSDVLDDAPVLSVPETTQPAPIEASPDSDSTHAATEEYSEPSTGETDSTFESERLISQVYVGFDPAPAELPCVEGNDASNVAQFPVQERSKDVLATANAVLTIEELPSYREEFLPDTASQPDKQPGTEADALPEAEQDIQAARSVRRRNFWQRLVGKIRRS